MRRMMIATLGIAVAALALGSQVEPASGAPKRGGAPKPKKTPKASRVLKNATHVLDARRLWTATTWLDPMKVAVSSSRNRMTSLAGHQSGSGTIIGLTIYEGFRYDIECSWNWAAEDGTMTFRADFVRGGDISLPVQYTPRTVKFGFSAPTRTIRNAQIKLQATATEPWYLKSCSVKRTR